MQDPNCAFCKIIDGKIPARVIMENEKAMALLDAFPLAVGHTLVIPKLNYAKVQ
jgi:histidine triad (HIT) family protein